MFQVLDSATGGQPAARAGWMALLARAPLALLQAGLGAHAEAAPQWLRRPESGLLMVQGRAGGSGERFNLGEVTVTRCALRLAGAPQDAAVGVAYVMGRSQQHARLAAVGDALLQDPARHAEFETRLLAPIRRHLAERASQREARSASTAVEFFTVAREAGGGDGADNGSEEA